MPKFLVLKPCFEIALCFSKCFLVSHAFGDVIIYTDSTKLDCYTCLFSWHFFEDVRKVSSRVRVYHMFRSYRHSRKLLLGLHLEVSEGDITPLHFNFSLPSMFP